jgi:hypothetical protein
LSKHSSNGLTNSTACPCNQNNFIHPTCALIIPNVGLCSVLSVLSLSNFDFI